MKKLSSVLALVLIFATVATLFTGCGKKAEFFEMDKEKVVEVFISPTPEYVTSGAVLDKDMFTDAYNKGSVTKAYKADDEIPGETVIVYIYGEDTVQVYYLGEAKFVVVSSVIETSYEMTCPELENVLLRKNLDEYVEAIKIDPASVTSVIISPDMPETSVVPEDKALIDAFNKGVAGGAYDEYTAKENAQVSIIFMRDTTSVTASFVGNNKFFVKGSDVKMPYFIEAPELAALLADTVEPTPYEIMAEDVTEIHVIVGGTESDKEVDTAAVLDAYNSSTIGNGHSKFENYDSEGTIIIVMNDKSVGIEVLGNDDFIVSSSDIELAYHITSAELTAVFNAAK